MSGTISIPKLHAEYKLWINELNFYKDEIRIFERHLELFTRYHQNIQITSRIEHFQNQFICQLEVIDILKHDLHVSERQLAAFVRELSGMGLESIRMDNHVNLRDRMKIFRSLFAELKNEYRSFEAECMLVM